MAKGWLIHLDSIFDVSEPTCLQLHMIENRAKIEKQIFLGRQSIRKSLRTKSPRTTLQEPQSPPSSLTPQLKMDPSVPPRSPSPPATGSDHPLAVDTDAEAAFANGSGWFFKRGHFTASPSASGASTPWDALPVRDPLRSAAVRRKWASDLLNPASSNESPRPGSPQPNPPPPAMDRVRPQTNGFFSRLRTKSFPSLTTPFTQRPQSGLARPPSFDTTAKYAWSSDSSSSEDLSVEEQRRHRKLSD